MGGECSHRNTTRVFRQSTQLVDPRMIDKLNKMPIALACTRDAVMMPDSEIAR